MAQNDKTHAVTRNDKTTYSKLKNLLVLGLTLNIKKISR